MLTTLARIALVTFACLSLSACAETPQDRLEATWVAAEDERFEDFIAHFSARSAPLIRGLLETSARTKRAYRYINSPYDLLPRGEIEGIEERDAIMVITVKADERYTLRMVSEGGQWVIDGVSLATLWRPLRGEGEEG